MRNRTSRQRRFCVALLLMLAVAATAGPVQTKLPFGAWSRASKDPVISPQGEGFESAGTFNPSAV